MTNQNLGLLLHRAGVEGGKSYMPIPDTKRGIDPGSYHPHVAQQRLPECFATLKTAHDGKHFTGTLRNILKGLQEKGEQGIVTEHVVYGLLQLACSRSDSAQVTGRRRASFTRKLIPRLVSIKKKVEGGKKSGLCEFILEKIEDLES